MREPLLCVIPIRLAAVAVAGVGENARDDCRSFDISSSERESEGQVHI